MRVIVVQAVQVAVAIAVVVIAVVLAVVVQAIIAVKAATAQKVHFNQVLFFL